MNQIASSLEARVSVLERSLRRSRSVAIAAVLALVTLMAVQYAFRSAKITDEVRTRRLVVVDEDGRQRVEIAQDPTGTGRRSRSAGLWVFDSTGNERGGFSTLDDGSVVLGMDAPHGVGNPMPDRIGLTVSSDGSAAVMLIDNQTRAVVRLNSDGTGGGGVQTFKWDMNAKQIHIRTTTYEADQRDSIPMGSPS